MIPVQAFLDELEKISINLQQLTKLEGLAGKGTVQSIMHGVERQSGAMGKKFVQHRPMTLKITPQGISRMPLTAAPIPVRSTV
jgi:hypothetical protein